MSFNIKELESAIHAHKQVVRTVIANISGSSPREIGASMLVWDNGQAGTIGGGALEFAAAKQARAMIVEGHPRNFSHHALGPDLGQCCGGRVSLLSELYDSNSLKSLSTDLIARPTSDEKEEKSLAIKRILASHRARGEEPAPVLLDGWMIEPVSRVERDIWIWGAGHVGRALVHVLSSLPDLNITWVDTNPDRFPDDVPSGVAVLPQPNPADLMRHAPAFAEHYFLTYSHALDLELCHTALKRGFRFAGLIGSATKWARFRKRLNELGHSPEQIARITCPIGDPVLGKHPAAIAVGVANNHLLRWATEAETKGQRA